MMFTERDIILASASPRRRELLQLICESFRVCPARSEETASNGLSPEDTVIELSRAKALSIDAMGGLVIGADTLVFLGGRAMGKPCDESDAFNMLRTLSGREHHVYTGVTVIDGGTGAEYSAAEKTSVFFVEMTDADIHGYIATGEPMDKAGAYAIQGGAARFIRRIEGCYFNVMGLPVHRTYMLLKAAEEQYA